MSNRLLELHNLVLTICRDKYAVPEMMAERITKEVDSYLSKMGTGEEKLKGALHTILHNFRLDEVMRKETRQFGDGRINEAIAEIVDAIKEYKN